MTLGLDFALLIKLAGSLSAVLLVVALVRGLGLGGDVRLRDADHARALAQEVVLGFDARDVVVDRAGFGALLKDEAGRHILIRRHGVHFVGRLLGPDTIARLDRNSLIIRTGEKSFGRVVLDLGLDAQVWAAGFRTISHA
jgi:hypothetical protein